MKEDRIQSDSFKWFHNSYCLKHHNPRCCMFSIPNELGGMVSGALSKLGIPKAVIDKVVIVIMLTMKSMGLTSGVSDTIVLMPGKVLFIEFKQSSGKQSEHQKKFQSIVENLGFKYTVCRSFEQFQDFIKKEI